MDRTSSCKNHPWWRSRAQRASLHVFLLHYSSLSLTRLCADELSRNRDASCQLISTSQCSYHATTQRSSTEHTTIITATTSNCYYLDTFRCRWYHWGNGNTLASSYLWYWILRSFRGLDLLHAYSECRRPPLEAQSPRH
ncbi:hypothetical protein BDR05DRAFT_277218 [Suillus weaverae]|nr:hypothetical protein BDR05DRAFT_277218 [Suillus weaverae]